MTDYYKTSLDILFRLLKDSGNDHWANWIKEDIENWIDNKNVDHHLKAFGGMGSINDLYVGKADIIGIWKNKLFETIKILSWSLAKGKISTAPIDKDFYKNGNREIRGWKCRSCGHSRIDKVDIEEYLSTKFLPYIIVDLIKKERFEEIINLDNFINIEEIKTTRELISKQITDQEIVLTSGSQWLWICPECATKDACVYRWNYDKESNKLIESNNNLKLRKKQNIVNEEVNGLRKFLFGLKSRNKGK